MRLLRGAALVMLMCFAATGALRPAAGQDTPPPARIEGDQGGFAPDDALLLRAAQFARRPGYTERADRLAALPAEERVALLRAGLRLADSHAAAVCADHLTGRELDLWERRRAFAVLADEFFDPPPGEPHELGNVIEFMSSADLDGFLERMEREHPDVEIETTAVLHKIARARHIPICAGMTLSPVEGVRALGQSLMDTLVERTDAHADAVLAAVLHMKEDELRATYGSAESGALAPVVAALAALRAQDTEDRERAEDPFVMFCWRALLRSRVTASDRDTLLEIARVWKWEGGPETAALLLSSLDDPVSRGQAVALSVAGDDTVARIAAVRAAHAPTLDRLVRDAPGDSDALAAIMSAAPERARSVLKDALSQSDAEHVARFAETLDEAIRACTTTGLMPDARSWAGLDSDLIAAGTGAAGLGLAGVLLPSCHTRRVAEEALRRARPSDLRLWTDDERVPGFLQIAAHDALLERLRDWGRSEGAPTRRQAVRLLLRCGDPSGGELLLAAFRAGDFARAPADPAGDDTDVPEVDDQEFAALLARSAGPAVRAFLVERLANGPPERRADDLDNLAHHDGLPETVDLSTYTDASTPREARAAEEAAVLDGRSIDALMLLLGQQGEPTVYGLGNVRDDRVAAYLRGIRAARQLELVSAATIELARLGDREARKTLEEVRAASNYRWGDDLTMRAEEGAAPPTRADLEDWIELLESSCCQSACSANRMDMLLGWPVDHRGTGYATPRTVARWWWDTWGPDFVWSGVAERFVPAPRDDAK